MTTAAIGADGSDIANNGTLVWAWNANGNAATTPVVNGISFPNATPASVAVSGFPALVNEANPAAGTPAHYTGDMAELMGDYMGTNNDGSNGTVTLSGLMVGTLYRVQFLHHQDINSGNQRTMQVLFGTGPSATGSFDCGDNTGYLTTVVFTADAASQAFTLDPASGSRAILNGVVLHEVSQSFTVATPVSRQVVQRDATNTADIPISGTVTGGANSIKARAVVMAGGSNNGTTTAWTTIDTTIVGNAFSGTLPDVPAGGWYQIEVLSMVDDVPDQSFTVTRVGVGDIYLTCGQSNASNRGTPAYSPNEDRFSALLYSTGAWSLAADPMPGAPVTNASYTGSPWSRFGEMLVDRDNIPVALVCFAESGSDVTRWLPANNDLYPRIRTAVQRFPLNGFKGILWHQGETNSLNANTAGQYQSWLSTVIGQSRVDAGWAVPWYVAEASRINAGLAKEEPIVAGQRATIYGDPNTFAGPVTDNFHQEGKISDDTVHFNAAGLADHAAQWAEILGGNPPLAPKNANLESNPALTDGARSAIDNTATTSPSVIAWRGLNAANDSAATTNTYGYYNPNSAYYLNTDDAGPNGGVLPNMSGKHVAFLEDSTPNACFLQTRRALLAANTAYTLTVAIGVRSLETTTTFGGATIELLADGNVIGSQTINRAGLDALNAGNAAGSFTDITLTATTSSTVATGQAVSIRIRKPGGTNTYLDFDNVRLTSSAVTAATNQSWKTNGPTDVWNSGDLNWDVGVVWTDGNNALFTGSGEAITVGDVAANNLSFTGNSYVLSGGTIHLNNVGSGVDVSSGVSATIGSSLAGSTGMAKNGAGTLVLTGSNTYNGTTTVGAGSLEIGGAGTLGSGNHSGAISNSGTLKYSSSATQTLTGGVSGTGNLVKGGASTLILAGANSYTGGTTITTGTLEIGGAGTLGSGAYAAAISNSETLRFNSSAAQTLSGVISGAGTLVKQGTGMLTLSGANTYTGSTTVNAGTLQLLRATGITSSGFGVNSGGTLDFHSNGGTWAVPAKPINLSGGTLAFDATSGTGQYATGFGLVTVNAPSSITVHAGSAGGGNTSNFFLDGGLTGSADLTISSDTNGLGVVLRNNATNYSGKITVNGNASATYGTGSGLALGVFSTAPALTNADLVVNGTLELGYGRSGGLGWGSGGAATGTVQVDALGGSGVVTANFASGANTRTLSLGNNQGGDTFSGQIANGVSGTISLIKNGNGIQTFSGANTYSGTTTVSGGTLKINGSKTGAGSVTISNTATLGGSGSIAGAVTVQSGGTLAPGNSAGNLTFTSTVDLQSGSTYSAEIAGAGSNDKITAGGTLTINGTIKVVLLGGYVPAANATFVLAAATIAGTPIFDFTSATLPTGRAWDTSSFAANGTIQVISTDPFDAWATANNVTGGKGGDDDHDGVKNLMEFATAANPQSGTSGARAYPLVYQIGGQKALTYTVAVRAGATFAANGSKQQADKDNVRYTVEASDQLGTWDSVGVTELAPTDAIAVQAALSTTLGTLDPAWQWHSFRTDGDVTGDPSDFIRLNVTDIP